MVSEIIVTCHNMMGSLFFDGHDGMTGCGKGTIDGCFSGYDENGTIPDFVTIGNNEHVNYGDTMSKIKPGTRKVRQLSDIIHGSGRMRPVIIQISPKNAAVAGNPAKLIPVKEQNVTVLIRNIVIIPLALNI